MRKLEELILYIIFPTNLTIFNRETSHKFRVILLWKWKLYLQYSFLDHGRILFEINGDILTIPSESLEGQTGKDSRTLWGGIREMGTKETTKSLQPCKGGLRKSQWTERHFCAFDVLPVPQNIKGLDSSGTEYCMKSQELLMETYFPGCTNITNQNPSE